MPRADSLGGDAESAEFDGEACAAGKARLSRRRGKAGLTRLKGRTCGVKITGYASRGF